MFLILGPSGNRRFPLTPFNRDLFVYSPAAEAPQARMGVTFLIGADGKASAVRSRTPMNMDWGAGKRWDGAARVRAINICNNCMGFEAKFDVALRGEVIEHADKGRT